MRCGRTVGSTLSFLDLLKDQLLCFVMKHFVVSSDLYLFAFIAENDTPTKITFSQCTFFSICDKTVQDIEITSMSIYLESGYGLFT